MGHFSASVSKPPAMMLSLTSNCDTQMLQTHGTGRQSGGTGSRRGLLTLRSLGREGSLASDLRPTLTMLRTSSSVYSSVSPSTSPSPDWQLSTNRSTTYQHTKGLRCQQQTEGTVFIRHGLGGTTKSGTLPNMILKEHLETHRDQRGEAKVKEAG